MTRLLLLVLILLASRGVLAAESAAVVSSHTAVTLVSETDSVAPGKPFRLGLRFRMAPGWHIYWQNPGDAGLAPTVTWTLPTGARAGAFAWPTPVRERDGPLVSYAYTGSVLLPVAITPAPGGGAMEVGASADWLVCERVCVPESGTFHLALPAGAAGPSPDAVLFAAANASLPQPSPFAATITPDARLVLTGAGLTPARIADAWFFPAAYGPIDQNAAQTVTRADDRLTLQLKPGQQWKPDAALAGVLVLRDRAGNESALGVTAQPGAAPATGGRAGIGLADALLLALAGGLVLNLMPCVFPVLVMKGLAIARLGGAAGREVRREALSYAAGIVVAFTALGGLLLVLRATGSAAGWGFQFQSPLFVVATAWLLFAIGLNLSGLFEVGGGRLAGVGQTLASRSGHAGSFFTGLLAVLVATPCTAPFMGGAVAAALASPAPVALGIFACLGLGLAAPSVLLAAVPGLARALPRPGAWMEVLRQALAFPMYAAAIWLLWVTATQAGPTGVFVAAAGAGLLALGAWAYGRAQRAASWGRGAGRVVAIVAALLALALLPDAGRAGHAAQGAVAAGAESFSDAKLAALRAAGRPVFVDMTAAWCITCLVNERIALSPSAVRAAFAAHNVAYLKGDWTRQDPEITAFLHAAGRDGVPLYVFYPAHGAPVVLPQILTPALVLAQVQSS